MMVVRTDGANPSVAPAVFGFNKSSDADFSEAMDSPVRIESDNAVSAGNTAHSWRSLGHAGQCDAFQTGALDQQFGDGAFRHMPFDQVVVDLRRVA